MYKYYVILSLLSLVSDEGATIERHHPMKPVATIVYRQIAMELADVIVVIRLSTPKKPKYLHENLLPNFFCSDGFYHFFIIIHYRKSADVNVEHFATW